MTPKYHLYIIDTDKGTKVQLTERPLVMKRCNELVTRHRWTKQSAKFEMVEQTKQKND
jgi:hypothetical protein